MINSKKSDETSMTATLKKKETYYSLPFVQIHILITQTDDGKMLHDSLALLHHMTYF